MPEKEILVGGPADGHRNREWRRAQGERGARRARGAASVAGRKAAELKPYFETCFVALSVGSRSAP